MKLKIFIPLLVLILVLSACGQDKMDESITLLNQDKVEVSFPTGKPVIFFFMTTYT